MFSLTNQQNIFVQFEIVAQSKSIMWKLQNFSVTQILREIKVSEFRVSKSVFVTHLEYLKFGFMDLSTFWKLKYIKVTEF